jgi:hypothetical protein
MSQPPGKRAYRDAHRWVFDPVSFDEIVGFLSTYAQTGLTLEAMPNPFECEFYAVLRKKASVQSAEVDTIEALRATAFAARRLRSPI